MGQIIDLDYVALKLVMDMYGIEDQVSCFERIVGAFRHFLRESNKNKDEEK